MFTRLVTRCRTLVSQGLKWLETQLLKHTRPSTAVTLAGAVGDLLRGKEELIVENALLRQQLVVLSRRVKRPALTDTDRGLLVLLASRLKTWRDAFLVVKPDTLLGWHRKLFA